MQNIFELYAAVLVILMGALAFHALRSDATLSRRYVRARVRVDEQSRRAYREPQDEETASFGLLLWLVPAAVLFVLILLLQSI